LAAQPPDFCQRGLFPRVGFEMLTVLGDPGAERDVPDALALVALVPEGVARAFSDGFPLPLGDRRHCGAPASDVTGTAFASRGRPRSLGARLTALLESKRWQGTVISSSFYVLAKAIHFPSTHSFRVRLRKN
jgi:hypothetical protein